MASVQLLSLVKSIFGRPQPQSDLRGAGRLIDVVSTHTSGVVAGLVPAVQPLPALSGSAGVPPALYLKQMRARRPRSGGKAGGRNQNRGGQDKSAMPGNDVGWLDYDTEPLLVSVFEL
jgi:hypothetical protein